MTSDPSVEPASTVCDSCGADTAELTPVHRKYVTPPAWDRAESERVLDEVERWCFPCLTHYPHEPATRS